LTDRPAKIEGRLRLHHRFPSRYLSGSRDLIVYLPPGYHSATSRYPVLYLQDGQNLFDPATAFAGKDWQADLTADTLIRARAIEPLILVGIYHTGIRRASEYTPTRDRRLRKGGKGDRYAQMVAREIKSFIDGAYRTRSGASNTGIGGSSLGGLAALQAGLMYPKVFGKLAILSPSVWWDERAILSMVQAKRKLPLRIWLDCGTEEGDDPEQVLSDIRLLDENLRPRTVQMHYSEIAGAGHNERAWGARFGDVLRYLFPLT
jgi:predicted alpha/beta superfamily hydrolase